MEPQSKKLKHSDGEGDIDDNVQPKETTKKIVEFNKKRVKILKENLDYLNEGCKGVVYWMARDQRVQDNWALIYAQMVSVERKLPLHVVYCLSPKLPHPTARRCHFMFTGLKEVEKECRTLNIGFHLLVGEAGEVLPDFMKENNCGCLITDMSPLKFFKERVDEVDNVLSDNFCFYQVDAHNVVPVWEASDKVEYAARTIRPKLHKKVGEFLTDFPPVTKHPFDMKDSNKEVDWDCAYQSLNVDESVGVASKFTPGTIGGMKAAAEFIDESLKNFSKLRNDPNVDDGSSNLSPWLNFGQISAQKIIILARKSHKGSETFVEEVLVRRELADNFCYYQPEYNTLKGCTGWAKDTLNTHQNDKRAFVYSKTQLEEAKTHDDLWNAAQLQMVKQGKMHGFLRMYWAKKILEWTESPEEALEISMYLNDHYELDGCDPNGIVGCMWSICGVHDTAWAEREVFGKIRYMNYKGCTRKFDVKEFVKKYTVG